MNAPQRIVRPWDWNSAVLDCETCHGTGNIDHRPWLHPNDPDNWVEPCDDCESEGIIPCPVCGFEHQQIGYDCLACAMVADLEDHQLTDAVADDLAKAVKQAIAARAKGEAS